MENAEKAVVVAGSLHADLVVGEGESITGDRGTSLRLKNRGDYVCGKYLGTKSIDPTKTKRGAWRDGSVEPMRLARIAVLETNVSSESGPICSGEVCEIASSGLLAWALNKVAEGRMVYICFKGQGPGEGKDGKIHNMNRYDVRDVTEFLKNRGIQ